MPMYDFQCRECGAARELLIKYEEARALALVCTGCGGEMTPALSYVTILGDRSDARRYPTQPACRHTRACRCGGVKLTKPNPFRRQIEAELKPPRQ